jgi:hypothetical protein
VYSWLVLSIGVSSQGRSAVAHKGVARGIDGASRCWHHEVVVQSSIDPAIPPSGTGCAECLAVGGWWFHLRRCAECGNIGCCDSSPAQHAGAHAAAHGHPVARSFEPGESWFWNYETNDYVDGPELAPPTHRPEGQPSPGPAGNVPADWMSKLH